MDTIIFPVFHPAAALYTPANRKVLEEDFESCAGFWTWVRRPWGFGSRPGAGDDTAGGSSTGEPSARSRPSSPKAEQLPLW